MLHLRNFFSYFERGWNELTLCKFIKKKTLKVDSKIN